MDIYGGQSGYRTSVAQQMDEEQYDSPRHFHQNSNYFDISEREEKQAATARDSNAAYYEPYYGGASAKGRQSSRKSSVGKRPTGGSTFGSSRDYSQRNSRTSHIASPGTNSVFHRRRSTVTDLVTNPQGRRGGGIPRNDSNSGLTTGISLQVKQWKTIHEFESDEQQKYLVFASLKCRSIRIFYLMLISLLLMAVDLSLTSQATITSKSNVQRFVLPTCWSTLSDAIGPQDIIEFTYDLLKDPSAVDYFGSNKYFGENSTFASENYSPQYNANISYQEFIEREILFGDLNGQSSSLIHHLQNVWAKKRISGEFRFHPLSSEQSGNSSPSTWRSIQKLYLEENWRDSTLYISILITRFLAFGVTILTIIYLVLYYIDILHLNISKKLLPENTPFLKQPELVRKLVWSVMLTIIHMPPGDYFMEVSSMYPLQLFTLFRLLHTIKWLRETNPMRYNRMTEILCTLSSVRLRAKFLMKIPFMRNPLTSIIYTYLIILTVSTFTIFSLESKLMNGYCLTVQKSIWVVMVTTTNLGYGDVIVGTGLSKTMLGFTSIAGIAIMALLVNYVSGALVLPADERRIIGFFDKHRTLQLQRIAASNLIKSRWRLYKAKERVNNHFKHRINNLDNVDMDSMRYGKNKDSNFEDELRDLMHDSKIFEIDYQQQHRHWLKIKGQANQIQYQLQKGFTQEDTAIQATYISRKLDDLEAHIASRANERRKTVAGLNALGSSDGVAKAGGQARMSKAHPEVGSLAGNERISKLDINQVSPERKQRMESLRKNTARHRWKRIGTKTMYNNDSKVSPWINSKNPFEALAKQSKKRHKAKINSQHEDDDIQVEKLLAEEEAAIYREEEEAKQLMYQSEQDITQARIENLETMLVGINCCLERVSEKIGVDGPPKAIISQQLSTIEQGSYVEGDEEEDEMGMNLPRSSAGYNSGNQFNNSNNNSRKKLFSSNTATTVSSNNINNSSNANNNNSTSTNAISSKSTSKQNSNKELLTTTDGDDQQQQQQPKASQISIDITRASR